MVTPTHLVVLLIYFFSVTDGRGILHPGGHAYNALNLEDLRVDDETACRGTQFIDHVNNKRRIGNIVSPGVLKFPRHANKTCSWTIVAPDNYRIWLHFDTIRLDHTCVSNITIYDGWNDNAPKVDFYCSWDKGRMFWSPGHVVHIQFNSHVTPRERLVPYFSLWYSIVKKKVSCPQFTCRHNSKYGPAPVTDMPSQCYTQRDICDGIDDCGDGTDEENCAAFTGAIDDFTSCGRPPIHKDLFDPANSIAYKIKGGRKSKPGSWPWQVSLSVDDFEPKGHVCGGVLISRQWIVTAAHCFLMEYTNPSKWSIHLGRYNKIIRDNSIEVLRYPKEILIHENFSSILDSVPLDARNDIALVRMNAPVPIDNDYIHPVCLPESEWRVKGGDRAVVTGWGLVQGTGCELALKQAIVPVVDGKECATWFNDINSPIIDESLICAGFKEGGDDTCTGDSGGPFITYNSKERKYFLMGIISNGDETCGSNQPGLYTSVAHFIPWLHTRIHNKV